MNKQQTKKPDETALPLDQPKDEDSLAALAAENEHLKKTIRLRDARDSVTKTLASAGARSPNLLFDSVAERLEFDPSGTLQNEASIVGSLKQAYPEQFADGDVRGPQSIDAGTGVGQKGRQLTREALSGMTAQEIAKLDWAEVRQALSN